MSADCTTETSHTGATVGPCGVVVADSGTSLQQPASEQSSSAGDVFAAEASSEADGAVSGLDLTRAATCCDEMPIDTGTGADTSSPSTEVTPPPSVGAEGHADAAVAHAEPSRKRPISQILDDGGNCAEVGTSGVPVDGAAAVRRAGKQPTQWTASEPSTGATGSCSTEWQPGAPRKLLHIFSGPGGRMDGLRQFLRDVYGIETEEYDTLIDPVGCDLTRSDVFDDLLRRIERGEFFAAVIGTPCGTFSVARIIKPGAVEGPPQVRDYEHPEGMPGLPAWAQRQVEVSNLLVERSVAIARAMRAVGGSFIIENPATRSDSSSHLFRWAWRSHASLWMHALMKRLKAESWTRHVTFPQCELGGVFQKYTTLLYTCDLHPALRHLGELRCSHARHAAQAAGLDEDGKWRSAAAAAYPAAMNALLADACVQASKAARLFVGSAKPHAASQEEADMARPSVGEVTAASLRRLDPEEESVLRVEALPAANVAPVTTWDDGPALPSSLPEPLRTVELFPSEILTRLEGFRVAVSACFSAARRGRWKWARDHRPPPLHATEEECLTPAGRGWTWAYNSLDQMWHAVSPSRWPESPPPGELETALIIEYAVAHGFSDMEIVSYMAHGYPGPELSKETVLGPPHVGALRDVEAFEKCADKDRARGWVKFGYKLPPVWPMRADPMNIVWRNGKPRMTIDKSMQLVYGVDSYNACIDLDAQPSIEYVTVAMLGRAAAVLKTSGVRVKVWGYDLEAYFRKTGKQVDSIWASGFCHGDGFGVDERVQFGQREAPVLTGRQSCFIVWAIRRELRRLDAEYKPVEEGLLRWLASRAAVEETSGEWRGAVLSFVLQYVDDVGAASIDDELFRADGSEWWVLRDGERFRMTRAWLHFEAAVGVAIYFGHAAAQDKLVPPSLDMVYLGVTVDVARDNLSLSGAKCESYGELVRAALGGAAVEAGLLISAADLSAIIHRLLHAAAVVALGRQHLFHLMRASKGRTRLKNGVKVLGAGALAELRWWADMLGGDVCVHGLPLAYRRAFPSSRDASVLMPYSDASREIGALESSGFGAWAVVNDVFMYVEGRWTEAEVEKLDINTLELAAMNIGTFTLLAEARRQGLRITHVLEFTDNTSAEHSVERGKPKSERLGELVRERYEAMKELSVIASATRVTSADNDIADGLSRGGEKLTDALRMAAAAGMPVRRLRPEKRWRALGGLC